MFIFRHLKDKPIGLSRSSFSPVSHKRLFPVLLLSLLFFIFSCAHSYKTDSAGAREEALSKRNMGEAYIMHGNFTSALGELLQAERLNPDDPITHNYLGISYNNRKMHSLAVNHFKRAVELNPGYSQARNNLGAAYIDMEEWDEAIACFKEVVEDILYATPQYPYANLGWAYYNKKEYEIAVAFYKKALEKQPNMILALHGLGRTHMAQRNYPEAIDTYRKAIQHESRVPLFHFQLARASEFIYNYTEALQAYRRVIDISPDDNLARESAEAIKRITGSN